MNGYELSRAWYSYKFENLDKVRAIHSDLYFYIVDLWNRLGQKENIGLPTDVTMECLGIGSYNTYKKTLDDLINFGFVVLVKDSKNAHHSKQVALSFFDKALDKATAKALDKATAKALDKATAKVTDTIIEQGNKGIKEQGNIVSGVVPPPTTETDVFIDSKKSKKAKVDEYNGKYKTIDDLPPLKPNIDYHICPELRLQVFRHLEKSPNSYPPDEIAKFVKYWSELNEDRNLPKWKITKQKTGTWQVASRLSTWINNNQNYGKSKQLISPIIEPRQGKEFGWTPRTA